MKEKYFITKRQIAILNSIYAEDRTRVLIEILENQKLKNLEEKELSQQKGNKKKPKLKILACAVLNEDNPEFFSELLKKGVNAVEPEMEKQVKEQAIKRIEKNMPDNWRLNIG
jgi:adenine-specific DNA methylase